MLGTRHILLSLATLALCASFSITRAEDPKPIDLFDGKTLDGWKVSEFYKPGDVTVKDGEIHFGLGSRMTGITSTRKDLFTTDYELTYEAKKVKGSDFFAAATFPVGKSHLTLVNGGWGGHVTGLSNLGGANASENETGRSFKYEEGTWYAFRIRVTDGVIRYAIDGKEMPPVEIGGRSVGTHTASNASKPLGFAAFETEGVVRKIQIRKLSADEVKSVSTVE